MPRVGGVIITHGQLATELLHAAEMIVGDISHVRAVSIDWHDDVDTARGVIERAIAEADQGSGVLLLTDLFGGTPTNLVMTYTGATRVEIVTGVNLPMVIKLATSPSDWGLLDIARCVTEQGRKNIHLASELVKAQAN
ncbi:MAG: PTS sugar transporter subunit IIA [Chloracidobacterium sp.]|uniref:PTS sugar transporter subunit IIA n=1 Tax=Chloracidobacterium validum TaxID=2821543 RepID=A0ABX8B8Q4_9BACT|nr:PTS sugar transporter subunit IIA [Chloracidobacterium validum]QUW03046.1 PTS sugar transporter subunit IIA [Chloracidobacterium validum]